MRSGSKAAGALDDAPECRKGQKQRSAAKLVAEGGEDPRAFLYRFVFEARHCLMETYGDIESALIVMVTEWSWLDGGAADISMISNITGISRPTVRRKLVRLEEEGYVVVDRTANRTSVMPTERLLDHSEPSVTQLESQIKQTARSLDRSQAPSVHNVTPFKKASIR